MFQLKRILFPVDFSPRSRGAAVYVETIAGRFEAEVILLHVIEPTYHSSLGDLHKSKIEEFDRFFDADFKYLRVQRLVEHGEAARRIVECASAHHVDLIMMPTQGMGIYRRLILGSTSAKVLHDADCPVWTGVHLENASPLESLVCRRILCAVDLKTPSGRVLDWANHLAEEYQAELSLVHVTLGRDTVSEARHALDALQIAVGSRAVVRVECGDPTEVVTHLVMDVKADLLVIGRAAESGVLGRLKMTAYSMIRQSPCPVVSV